MKCKNILCVFCNNGECTCKREPSIDIFGNCENVFIVFYARKDPYINIKKNYFNIPYGHEGDIYRREWRKYYKRFEEAKPDKEENTYAKILKNISNGDRP